MLKSKKINAALLSLVSSIGFAGTMGPVCTPGNVSLPCERQAWDFGARALYLKPSYSNSLAYLGTRSNETGTVVNYVKNAPDWSWGFQIEGSYHFNTGNDLTLNWYHLGAQTTTARADAIFGFFQRSMDPDTASIKPRWDAVNLEVGQQIDLGAFKSLRVHGGAQYARIKTDKIHTTVFGGSLGDFNNEELQYSGFGPRAGADLYYGWNSGLSVYANAAVEVLVGTSKFNSLRGNTLFPGVDNQLQIAASSTTIVPEIEAKLGVNYTHLLAQSTVTLDVGYMWLNYFQAQPVMLSTATNVSSDSSFSLQGPYAGIKWLGTIA